MKISFFKLFGGVAVATEILSVSVSAAPIVVPIVPAGGSQNTIRASDSATSGWQVAGAVDSPVDNLWGDYTAYGGVYPVLIGFSRTETLPNLKVSYSGLDPTHKYAVSITARTYLAPSANPNIYYSVAAGLTAATIQNLVPAIDNTQQIMSTFALGEIQGVSTGSVFIGSLDMNNLPASVTAPNDIRTTPESIRFEDLGPAVPEPAAMGMLLIVGLTAIAQRSRRA